MEIDRIICGDCLEILRQFPDNSIDAVVTDPPYGLNGIKDLPGLLRAWMDGEDGSEWQTKGFMGKGWDRVPPPSVWREVLRVMKPGAYILCFAGCRTVDLMGISLRLAGFEDNNLLAWLQGQGFPKATDVGKMIDRVARAERPVVGDKLGLPGYHLSPNDAGQGAYGSGFRSKNREQRKAEVTITAPATPEAKKWDGWKYGKQALKPAMEPILLMQKPFEKGLAGYQNVLKWDTGALNIEACRIGTEVRIDAAKRKQGPYSNPRTWSVSKTPPRQAPKAYLGRFPANVLLDEVAAQALDEQSGWSESNSHKTISQIKNPIALNLSRNGAYRLATYSDPRAQRRSGRAQLASDSEAYRTYALPSPPYHAAQRHRARPFLRHRHHVHCGYAGRLPLYRHRLRA